MYFFAALSLAVFVRDVQNPLTTLGVRSSGFGFATRHALLGSALAISKYGEIMHTKIDLNCRQSLSFRR